MLTDPPSPAQEVDLLIVGGLTVDRFADGSSAPGGTVLHATRSLARAGLRVGVITVAGGEPEANSGIDELRDSAVSVDVKAAARTTTFRHREHGGERRLWLEVLGGSIAGPAGTPDQAGIAGPAGIADMPQAPAILFAPLAGEVPDDALRSWGSLQRRGAILQGWLRAQSLGEVAPVPLAAVPDHTVAALSSMDVLIASRQDLVLDGDDPQQQLDRLRQRVGSHPTLIVTDGEQGAWIDAGNPAAGGGPESMHVPVPWVVHDRPTVGAGDILAAHLLADPHQAPVAAALERAMRRVAQDLEARPPL